MQTRPGSQAMEQLNRVAQGSAANLPLVFPLSGPASSQLGAVNQPSTATRFTNGMPPSSSGFSAQAPQSGGQSQLASDSRAPEGKGLVYEEIFQFADSGPAQHHGAGRGYDDGQNSLNFGSQGSTSVRFPFYQSDPAQSAGPSGVVYGNLATYNEGLGSNQGETVPQGANAQVMRPPPPPYNPVYVTRSRHSYSRARYTNSHSRYSPDPYAPMPVDPLPPQDVPVRREETHRYCT